MATRARASRTVNGNGSFLGAEAEVIELEDLAFDPENPRIVEMLGERATQRHIQELLVIAENARELVPSFMKNGFLPYEPVIVRPKRAGKHVILEGNRRVAALFSMRDSDDPDEKKAFEAKNLNRIPCLIFHGSEQEELAYLGLRHLSKTKDWSASAKSAFVERMLRAGNSLSDAAQITNTSSQNLRQLLLTKRLFERATQLGIELRPYSAEGDLTFWHLGDAVRRTRTKKYLEIQENEDPLEQPELNETNFERLIGWIYGNPKTGETKLIRSIRDIPTLDQCLGHPASTLALERGASIDDAMEEAQAAGYNVKTHLDRAKNSVQRATANISDVQQEGRPEVETARAALQAALRAFDRAFNAH